ncbi:hypothetical protein QBC47DRAFT_392233 [Echria macrotheca]|uniref:Succinate dehydrogenase assembly factor 4, mitochondrial n=1 Tax=Echria macrotheca TaxID=438768 RepID=A0AAJ0F2G4_9PEZI|nr:hypothetical protein QBC47DRAFT_392233 [Echria macrotheca]
MGQASKPAWQPGNVSVACKRVSPPPVACHNDLGNFRDIGFALQLAFVAIHDRIEQNIPPPKIPLDLNFHNLAKSPRTPRDKIPDRVPESPEKNPTDQKKGKAETMSRLLLTALRRRPGPGPSPGPLMNRRLPLPQISLRQSSSFLQNQPAPPRLPADQQAEFERLQRAAEASLSSHNDIQPDAPLTTSRHVTTPSSSSSSSQTTTNAQRTVANESEGTVSAGTFSGGMRQGAPPEFEGDTNPKTGEVGGPKNEPLRWGSSGDWSYNGRVTDF